MGYKTKMTMSRSWLGVNARPGNAFPRTRYSQPELNNGAVDTRSLLPVTATEGPVYRTHTVPVILPQIEKNTRILMATVLRLSTTRTDLYRAMKLIRLPGPTRDFRSMRSPSRRVSAIQLEAV